MASNSQSGGPNVDELKLVASIAAGDRGALAALYDQYSSLLMGLGMKILNDRAEVEDLLHDVFVEIWQKAGSYDPARGSVRTWLCLRMRSRSLDRSKLSRRTRSESLTDSESAQRRIEESSANQSAPAIMRRERLLVALQALPDAQRKVISMAYFSGLSCSEIADSLKVPIGTVKSRLAGARKGLERAIQGAAGAGAGAGA